MDPAFHLPLKQRLKLIRQRLYAAARFNGHVPVTVRPGPYGAAVDVEGKIIHVPSPLRWKLYRKGWQARLDQLEREYGVGRHVPLKKGDLILDIGANAGEFAHVAARYGASIYCVEPDPRAFACLEANTGMLSNVAAEDTLIWKEATDIDFFCAPERADSSVFDEGQGPKIVKHATTVEQFCASRDIAAVDLLKCDAEGAEPEVLEGIGKMWDRIGCIALDTGAERKGERTNIECRRIMEANGLTVVDEAIGKRLMTFGLRRRAAA